MTTHNKVVLNNRPALVTGLPDDHVCMLGMPWKEHPQSQETQELICEIQDRMEYRGMRAYAVTGASGSGKDSFCDGVDSFRNIRFGDVMKDLAYQFGMVPHDREYYEKNRDARYIAMPNGKTPLQAWIALDILREYNPFVFVEHGLKKLIGNFRASAQYDTRPLLFSGMRTELGLDVVREICGHENMFRVHREGHVASKEAILDNLQVLYPVSRIVYNGGTLEDLHATSRKLLV